MRKTERIRKQLMLNVFSMIYSWRMAGCACPKARRRTGFISLHSWANENGGAEIWFIVLMNNVNDDTILTHELN